MPIFAQSKWDVNIHSGIAMTRIWEGLSFKEDAYVFKAAPVGGVAVKRAINSYFSLQGELNLDVINTNADGLSQLDQNAIKNFTCTGTFYGYAQKNIVLNYLSAAALAKLYFPGKISMYLEAGPFVSRLLYSNLTITGNTLLYTGSDAKQVLLSGNGVPYPPQTIYENKSMGGELYHFNAGACTGIGLALPMGVHSWAAGIRYSFGVLDITKNTKPGGEFKTDQLSLVLAYEW